MFKFKPGSSTIMLIVECKGEKRLMCFVDHPFEKLDASRPRFFMLSGHLDFGTAASE